MNVTKTPKLLEMLGGRFEEVMQLHDRGDAVLFRTTMQPGRSVPLHSHLDPEGYYVLAGEIEVFLMNETQRWHQISSGAGLTVEGGVRHAVRNSSHDVAELFVLTNRRLADYFYRAGKRVDPGTKPEPPTQADIDHLLAVTEEFGYWVATPEESKSVTEQRH